MQYYLYYKDKKPIFRVITKMLIKLNDALNLIYVIYHYSRQFYNLHQNIIKNRYYLTTNFSTVYLITALL